MRLWSLDPAYLDAKGLVALWREALLAQNVLQGKTRGYKHHPQLIRFKQTRNPVGAIARYLRSVADEAEQRGYHFDRGKIVPRRINSKIPVARGQLKYEWQHLLNKLRNRDPLRYARLSRRKNVQPHPLFYTVPGPVAEWEIT